MKIISPESQKSFTRISLDGKAISCDYLSMGSIDHGLPELKS